MAANESNLEERMTTSQKTKDASVDRPFKCPDCDATFLKATGLGSHRRMHGYVGTAPTSVKQREKAEAAKKALKKAERAASHQAKSTSQLSIEAAAHISKPNLTKKGTVANSGEFQCPECDRTFKYARVLGKHRSAAHDVPGKTSAQYQQSKQNKLERQIHGKNGHDTSLETLSPTTVTTAGNPPAIDPLAYAVALGSVKEYCRHFADEHGIPTRYFTRQFAELFLREARR